MATKYPNIARRHFASRGVHADVVHLNGAMELAPGLGLSRLIVDLVQTGSTLRANGLVETEVIAPITSRLIVNRTALKTQPEAIGAWIARFRAALGVVILREGAPSPATPHGRRMGPLPRPVGWSAPSTQPLPREGELDLRLRWHDRPGLRAAFAALLAQARETTERVDQAVAAIIADVRARGDAALLDYTARFDRLTLTADRLRIRRGRDRRGGRRHCTALMARARSGGEPDRGIPSRPSCRPTCA